MLKKSLLVAIISSILMALSCIVKLLKGDLLLIIPLVCFLLMIVCFTKMYNK